MNRILNGFQPHPASGPAKQENPMYVHVPQPSRNARKLSEQLVQVVREARKDNKSLSYMDICQACRLASQSVREEMGGMSQRTHILIAFGILAAVVIMGVVVALLKR
jgi:hypothetical protein